MTIIVYPDRIDFTNYSLRIDGSGLRVTSPTSSDVVGKFSAADIQLISPLEGRVAGYSSGGVTPGTPAPTLQNTIDKFPFATNANATDVGDLTISRTACGQSSQVSGYTSGGSPTPIVNIIDKFPFATNANATDVGDLTAGRGSVSGQSSPVSGYTSGGLISPTYQNIIDKFPFATNANATDVGDLTVIRAAAAGQQD